MDDFSFEEDGYEEFRPKKKLAKLAFYKVCEGCEQILFDYVHICPFCKAYRFSKNMRRVIASYDNFRKNYKDMIDLESDQY